MSGKRNSGTTERFLAFADAQQPARRAEVTQHFRLPRRAARSPCGSDRQQVSFAARTRRQRLEPTHQRRGRPARAPAPELASSCQPQPVLLDQPERVLVSQKSVVCLNIGLHLLRPLALCSIISCSASVAGLWNRSLKFGFNSHSRLTDIVCRASELHKQYNSFSFQCF